MSQVVDRELWKRIKDKWHYGEKGGQPGKWNARKAQLAVLEYKKLGGRYSTPRPSQKNSLVRWTKEDWGYIDGKKGNRYLPAVVRARLTASEKQYENRLKRMASRRGEMRASWSGSVTRKMRRLHRVPHSRPTKIC
jgi:hypothetical protein